MIFGSKPFNPKFITVPLVPINELMITEDTLEDITDESGENLITE